jgi:Ca-dependent carbohydrate-binding module xylan-binding/Calx-beta domain
MTTLPPGVTLHQIDGGPTYFADHGFTYAVNMGWDDPNFFSIGVFNGTMRSPSDATRWNDLGLNTMVGLGPSPIQSGDYTLMQNNGISYLSVVGDQTAAGLSPSAPFWVGNITADEITTFSGAVSGPISGTPNAIQDHRFWYENNNWFFFRPVSQDGGLSPYEADIALKTSVATPNGTLRHIDLSSSDTYFFAGAHANVSWVLGAGAEIGAGGIVDSQFHRDMTQDEAARGSNYGDEVDLLRDVQVNYFPAPIAAYIETGGPYTENSTGATYISPPELNWAVWSSLIHGAGQIIYFNHSFGGPAFSFDNLAQPYYQTIQPGQTISIYNQVKATDAMIEQLAPVINSPFALNYATVAGPHYEFGSPEHPLGGLEVMAKDYNGQFYIFADTRDSETQTNIPATFTINDPNATSVTVVNENRTIPVTNGVFTDTFARAWTVHIYQVNDSSGPPPPGAGSVAINDVTISEGDSGTKVATFTVTRGGGAAAFDVNFFTSDATATVADSDYVAASNTLHFGANENTKTISVTINGDTKVEVNETFNVVLSNATNGATISDSQGVGTITNDDGAATPNLVVNGGFESGNFSGWTLSGNSSGNKIYIAPSDFPGEVHTGSYSAGLGSMNTDGILTQNIATTGGQHYALSFWIESDNNGRTPINHFAAEWNGQTLMDVTNAPDSGYELYTFDVVGINGNSVLEFDGYNNPDAWRLDDVTLTAVGAAPPPAIAGSVSINDVTISEGNSGTEVATFTVTRSGGTAEFDVNFATSDGTATVADSDYVAASNTLHFGANENTKTISVTIDGDTKVEANETFNVVLSNATSGATISDNQGVGTITNDDGAATPNLVVNGGFETGNFSGWTLSGNSSGNQIYIAPTDFPGEVHTGSYSAGLGSMNRTDGILTQNIATTAGQHYTLSFWIESDNNGSTPINHFAAEWNGQTLMAVTDAPNSGYQLHTFDVVGINGNSVLEFDGYNNPDAWRLDDVILTAVGVAVPAAPIAPDELTLRVSEDAYQGDAQFVVLVDGHQIGGTQAVTASHAAAQHQDIVLQGDFGSDPSTVEVRFLNDAYNGTPDTDRNLYVDQLTINGHVFQGENAVNQAGHTVGNEAALFTAGSLIFHTDMFIV